MNPDTNIADYIYLTMYRLINGIFEVSFIQLIGTIRVPIFIVCTIAIVLVGYKLLYPGHNTFANSIKSMFVILAVLVVVQNSEAFYSVLIGAFIDIPLQFGNLTINAMTSAMANAIGNSDLASQNLSFNPEAGTGEVTAFGALWEFSTTLASRLWEEGGIRNMGALFMAFVLFAIAVAMLVVQIFIMATGLLLATACILSAPVFMWMVMFKPTKGMFEKWIGMGFTGGLLLYLMVVLLGIIIAFMSTLMADLIGYNIFNPQSDLLLDEQLKFELTQFLATMVFLASAIKILPKADSWSAGLGGFAAHELAEGLTQGAGFIGSQLKEKFGNNENDTPELLKADGTVDSKDETVRDSLDKSRLDNSDKDYQSDNQRDNSLNMKSDPILLDDKSNEGESLNQPNIQKDDDVERVAVGQSVDEDSISNERSLLNSNSNDGQSEVMNSPQYNDVDTDIDTDVDNNNNIKNEDNSSTTNIDDDSNKQTNESEKDTDDTNANRNEALRHFEAARDDEERRDADEATESKRQTEKLDQINSNTNQTNQDYSNSQKTERFTDSEIKNNESNPINTNKTKSIDETNGSDSDTSGKSNNNNSKTNAERKESKEFNKDD